MYECAKNMVEQSKTFLKSHENSAPSFSCNEWQICPNEILFGKNWILRIFWTMTHKEQLLDYLLIGTISNDVFITSQAFPTSEFHGTLSIHSGIRILQAVSIYSTQTRKIYNRCCRWTLLESFHCHDQMMPPVAIGLPVEKTVPRYSTLQGHVA